VKPINGAFTKISAVPGASSNKKDAELEEDPDIGRSIDRSIDREERKDYDEISMAEPGEWFAEQILGKMIPLARRIGQVAAVVYVPVSFILSEPLAHFASIRLLSAKEYFDASKATLEPMGTSLETLFEALHTYAPSLRTVFYTTRVTSENNLSLHQTSQQLEALVKDATAIKVRVQIIEHSGNINPFSALAMHALSPDGYAHTSLDPKKMALFMARDLPTAQSLVNSVATPPSKFWAAFMTPFISHSNDETEIVDFKLDIVKPMRPVISLSSKPS